MTCVPVAASGPCSAFELRRVRAGCPPLAVPVALLRFTERVRVPACRRVGRRGSSIGRGRLFGRCRRSAAAGAGRASCGSASRWPPIIDQNASTFVGNPRVGAPRSLGSCQPDRARVPRPARRRRSRSRTGTPGRSPRSELFRGSPARRTGGTSCGSRTDGSRRGCRSSDTVPAQPRRKSRGLRGPNPMINTEPSCPARSPRATRV